jgi:hypothetical protein
MLAYKTRVDTLIDASRQTIFDLVGDVSRHSELAGSGEVLRVRVLTPGPVRLGTRFEADEDIPMGPPHQRFVATSEVVAYDPPHVVAWTSAPPLRPRARRIQWWFRLSPEAGGTRVVHEVEVDFNPLMNVVFKLPYRLLRGNRIERGMERTLANLRQLAGEQREATAVASTTAAPAQA